jgi:hypothetical protein
MQAWGYMPRPSRGSGEWRGVARCLAAEGAWRALRGASIWPVVSRALGRLPPGS